MKQNACYSINRKKQYVTIYNTGTRYPLRLWDEYRMANDATHQEVANQLLELELEDKRNLSDD